MKIIEENQTIDRKNFIGGSDAAAIMGYSPYKSAYDVWLEKIYGQTEIDDPIILKRLNRGKFLEPLVVNMLIQEHSLSVLYLNRRFQHDNYDWMSCEIDFEWLDESGKIQNGEIKTVSAFLAKEWGDEFSDDIPIHYYLQAMHGLMVTGRDKCLFGVLIGGDDLRTYMVERNNQLIEDMEKIELDFWGKVINKNTPEATTLDDIKKMYKGDNLLQMTADENLIYKLETLKSLKYSEKEILKKIEEIELFIKSKMGESTTLIDNAGKNLVRWKSQNGNRLDQQKLKNSYPDIYQSCLKESNTRPFFVL